MGGNLYYRRLFFLYPYALTMSESKEKAEIEIGGGATIKGDLVAATVGDDARQVATGKDNTQTDTGGGAATQGNVVADKFTGRDDLRNYEDHRGGNVTFQNPDNAVLLQAIFAIGDKVAGIDMKLDGLPERVRTLELRVPWVTWITLSVIIGFSVLIAVFFAGRLSM